jgi:hypothetical protein
MQLEFGATKARIAYPANSIIEKPVESGRPTWLPEDYLRYASLSIKPF